MEFSIHSIDNVDILMLSGHLDKNSIAPIRIWFQQQIFCEPAYVIANLKEVSYLDSTALAVLVAGLNRARQFKGDLRLCCLPNPIRMLFELTRLDKVFEIYPTEDAAVQAFASTQFIK